MLYSFQYADVFALALVMVNLLTGQPLLEYAETDEAQGDVCRRVLGDPTDAELQDMGLPMAGNKIPILGPSVEVSMTYLMMRCC
jgi:hypothetical protein